MIQRRFLTIAVLALLFVFSQNAMGQMVDLDIPDTTTSVGSSIEVPIMMSNGADVGSMDLVVTYDPDILSLASVEKGDLTNGMVQANTEMEGTIIISIVDVDGITGDGELVVMSFDVIGEDAGSSSLTFTSAQANDVNTYIDIQVGTGDGTVTVEKKGLPGFELWMVVFVIFLTMLFRRS
ncbi:cohesin domain-containing protein [Methanococcoides methylutens]|uniref:cohesin domain-containing protein n=1 Tax=Methanococcoides methylutens TaxID=2226 RepID=UPI004044E2B0